MWKMLMTLRIGNRGSVAPKREARILKLKVTLKQGAVRTRSEWRVNASSCGTPQVDASPYIYMEHYLQRLWGTIK